MNKGLTITLIVILSIFTVILSAILVVLIKKDYGFNFTSGLSTNLIDEKEISNMKNINIDTDVAEIKVEEKEINNIKVELYSDYAEKYNINEVEDSVDVILKENKKKIFNFIKKASVIKIYVPISYEKNIKVRSNVGDIKIGNIRNASLQVKSDVGDVDIESVDDCTIKTRVGDIKIGDINNYLNLTTKTGDIKISNVYINKNSKIKTNVGDIKIEKTSNCYIEASSNVGDKKINQNDRKSDIILEVKSNVGDIDINR